MTQYKRYENESESAYIYRICEAKNIIGTWTDVQTILNNELGHDWTESAYRKQYQMGKRYLDVNENIIFDSEQYLEKIKKAKEALQKERYKLSTEKSEYNRWLRENARDELYLEKIIDAIKSNMGESPTPVPIPTRRDRKCGVLILSDCHYGKDIKIKDLNDNVINEYNPEIFKLRMSILLGEAIDYVQREHLTNFKVLNLGDSLDGLLRMSQIWTLREGVVDSVVHFGEFMALWLAELSKYAAIEYHSVVNGNHTELRLLDGRKGQHLAENTEKIVNHIIQAYNHDNVNLEVIENTSGCIYFDAAGYKVFGTHGDDIKDPVEAMKNYSEIYGVDISYLLFGHKHHFTYCETGNKSGVIGAGSLMGIDDFSMKIKKAASASASLITFEKGKGVSDIKQIILN